MTTDALTRIACNASPFTVHEEACWRAPPGLNELGGMSRGIIVSRWRGAGPTACEQTPGSPGDFHTVAVNLKEVATTLRSSANTLHEGLLPAGTIQVSTPGEDLHLAVHGAYDWLHVHVSDQLLGRCLATTWRRTATGSITLLRRTPITDPVLEGLARALLTAGDTADAYAQLYAEGISMALLCRLISVHSTFALAARASRPTALVRWRLKRAIDFMEEHLAEPITLPEIATAAGLTRMHFAAQFRAATGLRPKEFFLRRRIEHAKRLLLDTPDRLVDIALICGFQSQAHFTTVFKRFVGCPPHQWRCQISRTPAPAARESDTMRPAGEAVRL